MKGQRVNGDLVLGAVAARASGMPSYGYWEAKNYLENNESIRQKRIREGKHNPTIRNGKEGQ